ncbi:hypothetical protein LguiB_027523 [Lonicera macranthoides]
MTSTITTIHNSLPLLEPNPFSFTFLVKSTISFSISVPIMEDESELSSLRQRRKRNSLRLCCCFHGRRLESLDHSSGPLTSPRHKISPVAWFRSIPHLTPRSSKNRRHSTDFSYDPQSYALNFEEAYAFAEEEEIPMRGFAARLPSSPRAEMETPMITFSPAVVETRSSIDLPPPREILV